VSTPGIHASSAAGPPPPREAVGGKGHALFLLVALAPRARRNVDRDRLERPFGKELGCLFG